MYVKRANWIVFSANETEIIDKWESVFKYERFVSFEVCKSCMAISMLYPFTTSCPLVNGWTNKEYHNVYIWQ